MAEEVAAALFATDKDVSIGGAGLAAAAIELGLVDELRMFRYPGESRVGAWKRTKSRVAQTPRGLAVARAS